MGVHIQKVSHKKGRTSIRWLVADESGREDEFSLASNDPPRPELVLALSHLREHVIEICELGEAFVERIVFFMCHVYSLCRVVDCLDVRLERTAGEIPEALVEV